MAGHIVPTVRKGDKWWSSACVPILTQFTFSQSTSFRAGVPFSFLLLYMQCLRGVYKSCHQVDREDWPFHPSVHVIRWTFLFVWGTVLSASWDFRERQIPGNGCAFSLSFFKRPWRMRSHGCSRAKRMITWVAVHTTCAVLVTGNWVPLSAPSARHPFPASWQVLTRA